MKLTGSPLAPLLACLVLLSPGCSSGNIRDEQLKSARELSKAAEQSLADQSKLLDALDGEEAWLEAGRRRELDAFAARGEAAPVEKLRKLIAASHALEELRAAGLGIRVTASRLAALAASLEDQNLDEVEAEDMGDELPRLRLELASWTREQKIAEKRWREARAALGKEAFAPAPK